MTGANKNSVKQDSNNVYYTFRTIHFGLFLIELRLGKIIILYE